MLPIPREVDNLEIAEMYEPEHSEVFVTQHNWYYSQLDRRYLVVTNDVYISHPSNAFLEDDSTIVGVFRVRPNKAFAIVWLREGYGEDRTKVVCGSEAYEFFSEGLGWDKYEQDMIFSLEPGASYMVELDCYVVRLHDNIRSFRLPQ